MTTWSEDDLRKIRAIACRIVEGRVVKGEVDMDDPEALKRAVIEAGRDAKSAYAAALEYLSG